MHVLIPLTKRNLIPTHVTTYIHYTGQFYSKSLWTAERSLGAIFRWRLTIARYNSAKPKDIAFLMQLLNAFLTLEIAGLVHLY